MIGNAFPPPVAKAIGEEIFKALDYGITASTSQKQVSQALA